MKVKLGDGHYNRLEHKTRVYLNFEHETVLDNLMNRRLRPYNAIRPLLAEELAKRNIPYDKLMWRQNAGCSCGCSPGFILEGNWGYEYWLTVED